MHLSGTRSRSGVLFSLCVVTMLGGCPSISADIEPATDATDRRQLRVAVSANLRFAFEACRESFESSQPDVQLIVTYGASGNFFAQLKQRAPFDLFLSADTKYPQALVKDQLAEPNAYFPYARGQLAVWVRKGSALDLEQRGVESLTDSSVRKIAIANPRLAPYGSAAEEAIASLRLDEQVRSKLVFGDSVTQAAHFVESGAAQVGIIALSLALSPPMDSSGHHVVVPEASYAPIVQAGVVTAWCSDRDAAAAFRKFLTGPEGRRILSRFGYLPPADAT